MAALQTVTYCPRWGLDEAFQMLSPSAQVWEKWMKPRSAPVRTVLAHAGIKPTTTNQGIPLQLTPRPGENIGFLPARAPRALPGGLC